MIVGRCGGVAGGGGVRYGGGARGVVGGGAALLAVGRGMGVALLILGASAGGF